MYKVQPDWQVANSGKPRAVKRAKNHSLNGIEGIVVMESAETFHLACKGNMLKGDTLSILFPIQWLT